MLKLSRAATVKQYISAADHPAFTYPNADWSEYNVVSFVGDLTGSDPQYISSNNIIGTAGLNLVQFGTSDSNTAARQKVGAYLGSGTTVDVIAASTIVAAETRVLFKVRSGTTLFIKSCPILSTTPVDGSAVVTEASIAITSAYDGTGGYTVGNRSDKPTDRVSDQAFGRFGKTARALTDFEIAKIASGMKISDLGYTPDFEVDPSNLSTVADTGPNAIPFTVNGAPTVVADPQYAYGVPATPKPVISADPTITGAPHEGQPLTFTRGATTGSTDSSQQWSIDGVDVAGMTAVSPVAPTGSAGKSVRVRQIETNGGGTTERTSAPVTILAASGNAITVAAPAIRRLFQRSGTTAAVALSGTYTGTQPASIKYLRHDADGNPIGSWTAMAATIAADGTFSAAPALPVGGPYRVAIRGETSAGAVLATSNTHPNIFFVGGTIGWLGSSGAAKRFDSTSGTGFTPRVDVEMYSTATGWAPFGTVGSAILEANSAAEQSGMPIAMANFGVGGSTLADWLVTTRAEWTGFLAALAAAGGKLEEIRITVGSNDAAEGIVVSKDQHAANLRELIRRIREAAGQPTLPVLLCGMNRRNNAIPAQANMVRMAEREVGNGTDNIYFVQALDHALASDNVHLDDGAAGYPANSLRIAYVMNRVQYGGGVYVRGPSMASYSITGNEALANITHSGGTDLTPASGATGFAGLDASGVALATPTVTKMSATQYRLVFAAPPARITYLAGAAPSATAPVFDNAATPMPMLLETEMTATAADVEPAPDTTAPTLTGAVTASNVTATTATITIPQATDNVAVAGYEYSINGGTSYVDLGTARTANLTGLTPETTYPLRGRAYDAAGNRSAAITGTLTMAAAPPVADTTVPTITGTVTASNITSTSATISWPAGADNVAVAGYEYSINGGTSYIDLGTARTVNLTGLTQSTAYPLRARAYDAATPPNRSAAISGSLTTQAAPIVTPNTDFTPSVSRTVRILPGRQAYDAGPFWLVGGTAGPVGNKDPNSTIDIPFDWSAWLADIGGPPISNMDFLLSPGLSAAGVVPTVVGGEIIGGAVLISEGTLGGTHTVTCRITTATEPARIEDRSVVLQIRDQ